MARVRKVTVDDFDKIYPLLLELNNPRITKEMWKRLFVHQWGDNEPYIGYVLEDGGEAKGFIGLIFSRRAIDGATYKFCNVSSWIVKEEYRSESLSLIFPLLTLKDYTITNLTPSPAVYDIFRTLGFQQLDDTVRVFPFFMWKRFFQHQCSADLESEDMAKHINEQHLKIYDDHAAFRAIHALIQYNEQTCYLVMRRIKGVHVGNRLDILTARIPLLQVHYVSNPNLLLQHIGCIAFRICLRFRVLGLLIDDRLLKGHSHGMSISLKLQSPRLFRSEALDRTQVDSLYSELFLLNLYGA